MIPCLHNPFVTFNSEPSIASATIQWSPLTSPHISLIALSTIDRIHRRDQTAVAPPANETCPRVNSRYRRFSTRPICHASTPEWYRDAPIRIPLHPISGARKPLIAFPLILLLIKFPTASAPIDHWISPPEIQRPAISLLLYLSISFVDWSPSSIYVIWRLVVTPPHIFLSPPAMRSQPSVCSIQWLTFIPSPSFIFHAVFMCLAHTMLPRDEGNRLLALRS